MVHDYDEQNIDLLRSQEDSFTKELVEFCKSKPSPSHNSCCPVMNRTGGIIFSLASLEDFGDRDLAKRVITTILAGPAFMVPKRYGRNQPLRLEINQKDISPLLELWAPRGAKPAPGPISFPDGLLLMEFARNGDYLITGKGRANHVSPGFQEEFSGAC